MNRQAALLSLPDGRLPTGGYAHSGGLEPAVSAGRVTDRAWLKNFLIGRAETAGLIAAAFAAAACERARRDDLSEMALLEVELDARIPSLEQRKVSRNLGRQLRRAMGSVRPHPHFTALGTAPHQPVVMGVAAAALGLGPREAALTVLHENNAGAAAVSKVMRVDPFEVDAILSRMTVRLDGRAERAATVAATPPADLPTNGAPLSDIAAEHQRRADVRLFAS